ncbi:hypothetical protein [Bacteroides sp.]
MKRLFQTFIVRDCVVVGSLLRSFVGTIRVCWATSETVTIGRLHDMAATRRGLVI